MPLTRLGLTTGRISGSGSTFLLGLQVGEAAFLSGALGCFLTPLLFGATLRLEALELRGTAAVRFLALGGFPSQSLGAGAREHLRFVAPQLVLGLTLTLLCGAFGGAALGLLGFGGEAFGEIVGGAAIGTSGNRYHGRNCQQHQCHGSMSDINPFP